MGGFCRRAAFISVVAFAETVCLAAPPVDFDQGSVPAAVFRAAKMGRDGRIGSSVFNFVDPDAAAIQEPRPGDDAGDFPSVLPGVLNIAYADCSVYRGPEPWGVCLTAAVEGLEGHDHKEGVPPVEILGNPACQNDIPGDVGRVAWVVRTPEFASRMRIKWEYSGKCSGKVRTWLSDVRVDGLLPIEDGSGSSFVLVGTTTQHPRTHFARDGVALSVLNIVSEYNKEFPEASKLLIHDMSLPGGGVFDLLGDWRAPHSTHRFGNQVDILYERIPAANRKRLEDIFKRNGARVLREPSHYHLDFAPPESLDYREELVCF